MRVESDFMTKELTPGNRTGTFLVPASGNQTGVPGGSETGGKFPWEMVLDFVSNSLGAVFGRGQQPGIDYSAIQIQMMEQQRRQRNTLLIIGVAVAIFFILQKG